MEDCTGKNIGFDIGKILNDKFLFSYDTWNLNFDDLKIKECCDILYANEIDFKCVSGLFLFKNEADLNILKMIM